VSHITFPGFECDPPDTDSHPELMEITQDFDHHSVTDLTSSIKDAMEEMDVAGRVNPGDRILVGAGSRGIAQIVPLLREVCAYLRELQAEPFILGAMGSHGGGSCTGQREILTSLGITEEKVGAPVETSTEVECVGRTSLGRKIYCDPQAIAADGVLVVNRIKPHTSATGGVQSGIIKMLVVGLGHQEGAESFHQTHPPELTQHLCEMGEVIAAHIPLLGGIAVIENAYKEVYSLHGVSSDTLEDRERELLRLATELMPTLPFEFAHSLIVKTAGKNYSGTGMDTNVIGRIRVPDVPETPPFIRKLAALDLSEESHGNATGVGLADFITRRFAQKIDLHATYVNTFASTLISRAMMPMIMRADRDAIWAAIRSDNRVPEETLKLALIDNTLQLQSLWVTPALYEDAREYNRITVTGRKGRLRFDHSGDMICPPR